MGSLTRMCSLSGITQSECQPACQPDFVLFCFPIFNFLSGIIQSECQPAFVCEHAISDAQQICVLALGVAPEVKVLYACVLCVCVVRVPVRAHGCERMCVWVWLVGWWVGVRGDGWCAGAYVCVGWVGGEC